MSQSDNSTFNELVNEISRGEREQMLKSMNQGKSLEGYAPNNISEDASKNEERNLATELKNVSLLKKLVLWFIATFTSSTMEEVLNKFLIKDIARSVDKVGPGLVINKKKILGPAFYEKVSELKKAADFFAPYIGKYESNTGSYYMLLGSIVVPELSDEIQRESDPYQYALNVNVTNEMKNLLVSKMDMAIDDLSSGKKAEMYLAIRGVEWLRNFVKLPFGKITSKFEVQPDGSRGCGYAEVKNEFGEIARIMSNYIPLTDESVQALFMLNKNRGNSLGGYEDKSMDDEDDGSLFMDNAASQNAIIRMFNSTVPILNIARLVFENCSYIPDSYGGGEGWFQRFRAQWKLLFERRWNNWERDANKEKIKYKLNDFFMLDDFPLYPVRPWESVGIGKVFHYQLTLGFVNYYMKNQFYQFKQALTTIAVEGDFAMKDNRIEFSESLNTFTKVIENLELLASQLSASGEYGSAFASFEAKESLANVDEVRLDNIMGSIEKTVSQIIKDFGKTCRNMKNLLGGILGNKITPYYGPVVNFTKLGGKENRVFNALVNKASDSINQAYEFLQDVEPLDLSIEG